MQSSSDPSATPPSAASNSPVGDPPVMDYEGSPYRTAFWEGQGRDYEDAAERLALRRLVPPRGGRIAEIGAGFCRLADLYLGYDQIILFDYSRTLLQDAVARWGHDPRFVFVAGNIYQLSLAKASLDALVMVRVMHHLAEVPKALQQIRRVLKPNGQAVLEYANKRNLKSLQQQLEQKQEKQANEKTTLNFEHQIVLGHVSMLTDIAFVSLPSSSQKRTYLLSADRDEHIRVSRGPPQAHIIENYCLGHTAFVTKLCIPQWAPEYLISGGGDNFLLVWKWAEGQVLQKVPLVDPESDATIAVRGIWATSLGASDASRMILVSIEG